jgi:tRNA/rRNA methyltransferase
MHRIDVVLVTPLRPGNVGAVARAMKNTGAGRLILVSPCDHLAPEARRMAYGAQEILTRATVTGRLADAVARYRLVVGTTARAHKGYGSAEPIASATRALLAHARRHRIALVFGSEQNGLANEEIALCQRLVRLPMAAPSPSYNLAQAVLLTLYELFTAQGALPPALHRRAPSAELERMYADWSALLACIGFIKGRQGQHILADLRRMLGRAGLDSREVRILRGIARQARWAADDGGGLTRAGRRGRRTVPAASRS